MNDLVLPKTLKGLPRVAITERYKLPRIACVYFLMSGEQVLYVGSSSNLQSRWSQHRRLAAARELSNAVIAWLPVGVSILRIYEQLCIVRFRPELNERPASCRISDCGDSFIARSIERARRRHFKKQGYKLKPSPRSILLNPKASPESKYDAFMEHGASTATSLMYCRFQLALDAEDFSGFSPK